MNSSRFSRQQEANIEQSAAPNLGKKLRRGLFRPLSVAGRSPAEVRSFAPCSTAADLAAHPKASIRFRHHLRETPGNFRSQRCLGNLDGNVSKRLDVQQQPIACLKGQPLPVAN